MNIGELNMIDFDKPLEAILPSGECFAVEVTEIHAECAVIKYQSVLWEVYPDGDSVVDWMPKVYNAKRKPKKNEIWWCKWEEQTGSDKTRHLKEPVRFDGKRFPLVPDTAAFFEILEPYGG